ncbi:BON domain-containing protein [Planctomicrobium sp. SH661]|uniref:BON domain-containing protein n=1 Tax=Planctomicrobium sp. SH661 TaxID=3448124 RepID=UPI003F5CB7AD
MLLPRKWALSLGLLAAVPSLTVAGPLDFLNGNSAAAQSPERGNQEVAADIAAALGQAQLVYKDVEIEYLSGVATIKGQIQNASQRALVTRIVSGVSGVKTVENKLTLIEPQTTPVSAAKPQAASAAVQAAAAHEAAAPVQHASHQGAGDKRVQQVNHENAAAPVSNQAVAQNIADSMTSAGLSGYDIEIRYKAGVASLIGAVDSQEQAMRAHAAASRVPGVNQVLNQLTVNGKPVSMPQAAQRPQMPQQGVMPANYGMPQGQGMPPGMSQAQGMMPPGQGMPPGYPGAQGGYPPPGAFAGMPVQQAQAMMQVPSQNGPVPQYGNIQQTGGHHLYNQPNMPNYAWPSYAPYDNSAAISYPTQYDASAWPYIGPYYPYPQVPLDWRKSTLEWDDGSWSLKFDSKTDRWWWFLSPHNWH